MVAQGKYWNKGHIELVANYYIILMGKIPSSITPFTLVSLIVRMLAS